MPFMPEMMAHIGKRFTVTRRVEKICNMIDETGSRRMRDTVFLAELRCDGSAHGGCQAGCKMYWREEWLRRVDIIAAAPCARDDADFAELTRVTNQAVKRVGEDGSEIWRCQATDALKASESVKRSDIRQYWRELTSGNFGPLRFAALIIRAIVMECAFQLGMLKPLPLHGPGKSAAERSPANVRPGELVKVRNPREIQATLDSEGMNRGLSFDREMLPFCGQTFRVRERVQQIINERDGRMLRIPKDCIILEGAACSGHRSVNCRWFCPRAIYPFWRESWLERIGEKEPS